MNARNMSPPGVGWWEQVCLAWRQCRSRRREAGEGERNRQQKQSLFPPTPVSRRTANLSPAAAAVSLTLTLTQAVALFALRVKQLHNMEREQLITIINEWNINRLDLFELSQPNEVSCVTRMSIRVSVCKNLWEQEMVRQHEQQQHHHQQLLPSVERPVTSVRVLCIREEYSECTPRSFSPLLA